MEKTNVNGEKRMEEIVSNIEPQTAYRDLPKGSITDIAKHVGMTVLNDMDRIIDGVITLGYLEDEFRDGETYRTQSRAPFQRAKIQRGRVGEVLGHIFLWGTGAGLALYAIVR